MSGDNQPESDTAKAITDLTDVMRLMNEEINTYCLLSGTSVGTMIDDCSIRVY